MRDSTIGLHADAVFSTNAAPAIVFKDSGEANPAQAELKTWREAAWNFGLAPLLWVVTPTDVRLYNSYALPNGDGSTGEPLSTFAINFSDALRALNAICGRFATENGGFWSSDIGASIDRKTRVDRELLLELRALESKLSEVHAPVAAPVPFAQRLIGRCIFSWYLIDRNLAPRLFPKDLPTNLCDIFSRKEHVQSLFEWLRSTFNGDLFSADDLDADIAALSDSHLHLLNEFISGRSLVDSNHGQARLFRFRFDAIPVELISSIYEQFARAHDSTLASRQSLHYTPIELVNFVLDPVFKDLAPDARIIDPTCGSGVFLVEAFRRLVAMRAGSSRASRRLVRDVLYNQLFGIDINPTAINIAAFSLYLAALELDEDLFTASGPLKFEHLIGRNLFVGDALAELPSRISAKPFDAIVGNPPWKYDSKTRAAVPARNPTQPSPRRTPDHDFIFLANRLAGGVGRVGMIVKATPFFSRDPKAIESRRVLLQDCAPAALVNLSQLRKDDLFAEVTGPAALIFARCALLEAGEQVLVGSIPWTSTFRRSGVFAIGAGDLRSISLRRILTTDTVLKAATFATERDTWLIERLAHDETFTSLGTWLDGIGISSDSRGQGFQNKSPDNLAPPRVPRDYHLLRVLNPTAYTPGFIDPQELPEFSHTHLHRPRSRSIFRGPIVVCPKGRALSSLEIGRYSAAIAYSDCLYTESFYGISFAGNDYSFALALCGILNSSIASFQLAFGGAGWGLERSTVEPIDLLSLRIPRIDRASSTIVSHIGEAFKAAVADPSTSVIRRLDDAVFDLFDLEEQERTIVRDSVLRARPLIFGSRREYIESAATPTSHDLRAYAEEVTAAVNAFLKVRGMRRLQGTSYPTRQTLDGILEGSNLAAVRFVMNLASECANTALDKPLSADLSTLVQAADHEAHRVHPPYFRERRNLRVYDKDTVFVLKPAERRYWTRTAALNDADLILSDHWVIGAEE